MTRKEIKMYVSWSNSGTTLDGHNCEEKIVTLSCVVEIFWRDRGNITNTCRNVLGLTCKAVTPLGSTLFPVSAPFVNSESLPSSHRCATPIKANFVLCTLLKLGQIAQTTESELTRLEMPRVFCALVLCPAKESSRSSKSPYRNIASATVESRLNKDDESAEGAARGMSTQKFFKFWTLHYGMHYRIWHLLTGRGRQWVCKGSNFCTERQGSRETNEAGRHCPAWLQRCTQGKISFRQATPHRTGLVLIYVVIPN